MTVRSSTDDESSRGVVLQDALTAILQVLADRRRWDNDHEQVFAQFRHAVIASPRSTLDISDISFESIVGAWDFLLQIRKKHNHRRRQVQEIARVLGQSQRWALGFSRSPALVEAFHALPFRMQEEFKHIPMGEEAQDGGVVASKQSETTADVDASAQHISFQEIPRPSIMCAAARAGRQSHFTGQDQEGEFARARQEEHPAVASSALRAAPVNPFACVATTKSTSSLPPADASRRPASNPFLQDFEKTTQAAAIPQKRRAGGQNPFATKCALREPPDVASASRNPFLQAFEASRQPIGVSA